MHTRIVAGVVSAALTGVAIAGSAWAQDTPRDTPVTPKAAGSGKSSVSSPSNKTPIIASAAIGERAQDFWLDTSTGSRIKLSSLRGQWVVLVFAERYKTVTALDSLDADARPIGARVVGVVHEKQQTLTGAVERKEFNMLMLADATGEISAMYGLFDFQHTATMTGFFVLDRAGVVRLAIYGHLFPPHQMLELLTFVTQVGEPESTERSGP